MTRLTVEPHRPVGSLEDLFAIAASVAGRASEGYSALAARMRQANRTDLAELFESLAAGMRPLGEEAADRYRRLTGREPELAALRAGAMPLFDDEGMAATAPELISAYGALAMAVRNAERAFGFWTYVSAHAPTPDVRRAAEQMARHGLARVAALRRERRRAFHEERSAAGELEPWTLEAMERKLADLTRFEARRAASVTEAERLGRLTASACLRAEALREAPLDVPCRLRHLRADRAAHGRAAAELLLECYLDLAEQLPAQDARERAQRYAAEILSGIAPDGLPISSEQSP